MNKGWKMHGSSGLVTESKGGALGSSKGAEATGPKPHGDSR